MDGEFGLELSDPTTSSLKLGPLGRGQSRLYSGVDARLAPPGIERLITDPEVPGHVDDLASRGEQVECSAAELGGVSLSWHAVLLSGQRPKFQYFDSMKPRAHHSIP
jgi:hypothetical protein